MAVPTYSSAGADPWSDESVCPPPLRPVTRLVLVVAAVVLLVAGFDTLLAIDRDLHDSGLCRYDEAREGVLGEEKIGLPNGPVPDGWRPDAMNVEVRYERSDRPHGTVLDVSRCVSPDQDHTVVVIAR